MDFRLNFMSNKKEKNNNLTKIPVVANFKIPKIVIILSVAVVVFISIISVLILSNAKDARKETSQAIIDDQISRLAQKAKPLNFDLEEKKFFELAPWVAEKIGLPLVDQVKLEQEYIKDLKEIIAALEQQIQLTDQESIIDFDAIKIIKKKAMEEIVPRKHQDLHLDLILTLDSIINGDVDYAMNRLEEIKNNI